ncbi:LacI family DNA-binding transcriptional regulator [Streptomyces sp. 8L]|uniref:LacI family DNA-binding transcriptional regulator n=1 Tax=Streptomyces sp. 8L TaxID=2877242 RepID=UPI001CD4BBDF|nr:LacI family DNA-binding transcriptional regulator [Streptomyces sp. 8L]MCA1221254.1 LacI family transcriptional regulator [Streptomyces sp. 8L]
MDEVTLKDVASRSGCSVSTVSRVLAGTRPVGEEIAARVRAAARELGYVPNQVARSLRSRSTGTVGLVLPQITNPFYPSLVRELTHVLHGYGRAALLADSDDDPGVEAGRIADLLGRRVDALLVVPVDARLSRTAVADAAERVPLVLLDRGCGPGVADLVAVDNAAGIALILDHLAATGRRRPCFIGASGTDSAAAERRAAFDAGAGALFPGGGRAPAELGDFSVAWGRAAVDRLWPYRPDAVVCANDLIAIGALQRLGELGADVPGEVAVTGFDDMPMAALTAPGLTTVRQPVHELAAEAAALLAKGLDGGGPAIGRATAGAPGGRAVRTVRLAPELAVRASSVPAAAAAVSPSPQPAAGDASAPDHPPSSGDPFTPGHPPSSGERPSSADLSSSGRSVAPDRRPAGSAPGPRPHDRSAPTA